jgi:hypothetical protein
LPGKGEKNSNLKKIFSAKAFPRAAAGKALKKEPRAKYLGKNNGAQVLKETAQTANWAKELNLRV